MCDLGASMVIVEGLLGFSEVAIYGLIPNNGVIAEEKACAVVAMMTTSKN